MFANHETGGPMPSVIKLIEQDHREVEELFSQFEQSGDKNIAMKICTELDAHAEAEEKVFYPVVRDEVDGGLVKEAEKEHAEARQLIGRIKQTSDSKHLAELVVELKQDVEHHVQEEASEMLPKARESLGESRLSEIGRAFQDAKG